jgi:long-subunit fatty acid transport protein
MLNAGPHVVHNHFDQNRLSGGLGFNFNPKLNIALGYTHVFVQRNLPRTFEDNNIIQLTLNHQFSLSK